MIQIFLQWLVRGWLVLTLALTLVACGTVSQPTDQRSADAEVAESDSAKPRLQAVMQMAEESSQALAAGDYQAAIAAAERGLRIDRRTPELYLILAHSYRALGQEARARQFAEQGLRYVEDTATPTAEALQAFLPLLKF